MAKLKNYRQLQADIDRHPVRRARVDAERATALREQLEYSLAELSRAREITQEAGQFGEQLKFKFDILAPEKYAGRMLVGWASAKF